MRSKHPHPIHHLSLYLAGRSHLPMPRQTLLLLTLFSTASIFAQSGTIKGKVTNSINKEPIAYVAIGVEGTTQGGTSDDNGDYTVSLRATTSFLKAKAIPDQPFSSLLCDPRYSLAIPMG